MKRYYELLCEKEVIKDKIKAEKRSMHLHFVDTNKKTFRYLDIAVLVIFLFNIGALAITNAMVVKKEPEVQLYEVNPTIAEINDYELHEESKKDFKPYIKQFFFWIILIGTYTYFRRTVFTQEGLTILVMAITIYFILYGLDFFNDLGYYIGKLLFS